MGLTITLPESGSPSAYCTRSDIEDAFGVTNVSKWADLDDDQDAGKIAARITRAIAEASSIVDTKLRRSVYVVPVERAEGEDDYDPGFVNVVATLAGVWLYEARGVQDFDPDTGRATHRLAFNKKEAHNYLRGLVAGVGEANLRMVGTDGPAVVSSDEWDDAEDE